MDPVHDGVDFLVWDEEAVGGDLLDCRDDGGDLTARQAEVRVADPAGGWIGRFHKWWVAGNSNPDLRFKGPPLHH